MIGPRIARVFLRFPNSRITDPVATVAAYASDIAEFPLWAIEAGIVSLLRGQGGSSIAFVPSSVEVRRAVQREMGKIEEELRDLNTVLGAELAREPTEHERDRVKRLFRETLAELQQNQKPKRGRMTEEQLSAARQLAACIEAGVPDPRPLPRLSDEALAKFGIGAAP